MKLRVLRGYILPLLFTQSLVLLSENEDNISDSREGLRVLKQPAAGANNENVQERQKAAAERLAKNVAANDAVAKKEFPNETWVGADTIKLQHEQMPGGAEGIIIAKSKLPINHQEELDFLKEIKSAIILKG